MVQELSRPSYTLYDSLRNHFYHPLGSDSGGYNGLCLLAISITGSTRCAPGVIPFALGSNYSLLLIFYIHNCLSASFVQSREVGQNSPSV